MHPENNPVKYIPLKQEKIKNAAYLYVAFFILIGYYKLTKPGGVVDKIRKVY